MGPKKGKDVIDDNYWRTSIEREPLDEAGAAGASGVAGWRVRVALLEAAGGDQDRLYLAKFETFAALEKRFVIKNICRTETIFMINQLGGDKKVKDDNLRVFEEGQAYLKDKKDIPPDILALIIKHLILKMKAEYLYIKRQKLEVKEGMKKESETMVNKVEVRGTVSVKADSPPPPPPPPPKKGKGAESVIEPEPPELEEGKKYNTQLRVRGEEWRDRVYVDDFPIDGPNLYVALTGFTDPLLAGCLVKIGVPLTAIVQVRIDPTSIKIPSSLSKITRRGQSPSEALMEKSLKFWEDLQELRIARESADDFKNTAFIVFAPPYWDTEKLTGNPDKIYDELCYLMYDVQDLSRQHQHFLENMDLVNIPEDGADARCIAGYRQLVAELPLECVSVYSLLDSVLQTVINTQKDETVSSDSEYVTVSQLQTGVNLNEKAEKAEELVNNVFKTLRESEENMKKYRVTYGEEFESHKDPIVIEYGDSAKYATFHLGNINLDSIVYSSLLSMPINKLWLNLEPPGEVQEVKLNFHVNVLLSCFGREDVETAELTRMMHLLACRKLYNNRSSLHKQQAPPLTVTEFKNVYLKRSVLAEPLPRCPSVINSEMSNKPSITKDESEPSLPEPEEADEEYESKKIKLLFDCPDISELVSATEIAKGSPVDHMIDDYEFFEDFKGVSAFQVILDAFNSFNCVDYKYCEVTDCVILMFFNSHDKDAISRSEWRSHLPTPLCLQDFFDFVLDEHYDWIHNEEKLYDEVLNSDFRSECKIVLDPMAGKTCLQNTEPTSELLMEGSLKHKEKTELEDMSIDASEKSPSTTATDKPSKKSKSPVTSTPKTTRTSFMVQRVDSDFSIEVPAKPFSGYDLGDRRVEFFGKEATYFSPDGTRVTSNYYMIIPFNLEYNVLNLVTGNGQNEVWIHKITGEELPPEQLDVSESFRITTKDRVMFNLNKQIANVLVQRSVTAIPDPVERRATLTKSVAQKEPSLLSQHYEAKPFYSFCVTWPNGLVVESVHEENSSKISHVKLAYLTPKHELDEDSRCISMQGEVVIFRTDGVIDVLHPDGSYIKITSYDKQPVISVPPPVSETSSEKTKTKSKPGGKDKSKDKTSLVEEKPEDLKPPEYKLVIDEFEIIETSGLKQKCVGGDLIDVERLLIRTATDYCLGEIFSRRRDGTNVLLNKDGVQIVTFPNGTRIVSFFVVEDEEIYPEWTVDELEILDMVNSDADSGKSKHSRSSMGRKSFVGKPSPSIASVRSRKDDEEHVVRPVIRDDGYVSVQLVYTVEHKHFTTVTVDKQTGKITVDSPNFSSLTVDIENKYDIKLDESTKASFDGESLRVLYESCSVCQSNVECDFKIRSDVVSSALAVHKPWLKMKDCCGKKIVVNEEGGMNILDEPCSEEEVNEMHGEDTPSLEPVKSKTHSHTKCKELTNSKSLRFLVLHRDLSCSELVHRLLVDEHRATCLSLPWGTVDFYNTFGDYRRLLSALQPVHLNETEKWLMDSKLSGKPLHLVYKDLKKDEGKGFYHWMRPYERFTPQPMKPDNALLPHRLPRAFVLRTLEQQWQEPERSRLKGGKELLRAVLKYREVMESECVDMLNIPLIDSRTLQERETDELVQALGQRIYEELSQRLAEDVQTRTQADITTVPLPLEEEASVVGEGDSSYEIESSEVLAEKKRLSHIEELEQLVPPSAELQRYWRRRAEERKEEDFHKYLLREGTVPPYFKNVLGGAIWWEVSAAAGDAAARAERKKMRCVCRDEAEAETKDAEPFM